jgi:hypothetical protein
MGYKIFNVLEKKMISEDNQEQDKIYYMDSIGLPKCLNLTTKEFEELPLIILDEKEPGIYLGDLVDSGYGRIDLCTDTNCNDVNEKGSVIGNIMTMSMEDFNALEFLTFKDGGSLRTLTINFILDLLLYWEEKYYIDLNLWIWPYYLMADLDDSYYWNVDAIKKVFEEKFGERQ